VPIYPHVRPELARQGAGRGAAVRSAVVALPTVSPTAYRRITAAALGLLVFIAVTGAAVRLTGSGLGCSDWPTCEQGRVVAPLELHPMVEFVNRTITGLVSVAVALAVLGSLRRSPRRRDLTWLSLGLVAGVVLQIVLGGLVVLFELSPVLVQAHFVASMLLIADAVVLHHRAGQPDGPTRPVVGDPLRRLAAGLVALAAVVILTGTIVTGAGPHAGDAETSRLAIAVHDAARIHGTAMIAFLAATLWAVWLLRRDGAPAGALARAQTMLVVLVLQAAVGYTQYFTGIPPLLVGLHVLGASLVWIAVLRFALGLSAPAGGPRESVHGHPGDDHAGGDRTGRDVVAHR